VNQILQIYDEPDEAVFVDVSSTKDNAFVLINCNSKHSSEIHALRCGEEPSPPVMLRAREQGTSYFADHAASQFFLVTNADHAANYKIAVCDDPPHNALWRTLLPESPDVKIEDVDLFERFLVVYERVQSMPRIRVCRLAENDGGTVEEIHVVPLPDQHALCRITPGVNREPTSNRLRFSISTPLVPEIVYDYNLETRELTVLKETRVLGSPAKVKPGKKTATRSKSTGTIPLLNVDRFTCRRKFVTSHDGVQVPLTLLHRRDLDLRSGQNPTLLIGYGAYGTNLEADFELEHLSLLERGWIVAMAHVRGGGELGLRWYHDGKQLNKMNTFRDFEACTYHLLDRQYTNPARLAGKGTSAGGLIMGYMANTHPHLFRAMILKVPFVDILDTMQDPALPLTVHEYDEWGNPSDPKVFQYIQQYSPCANMVPSATYPSMLVTGSMNDIRVQFWEPVKWVHRLRRFHAAKQSAASTSSGDKPPLFLLRMSEDDGHFGGGGRLEQLQEAAMEYAFLYQALRLPFDE
jgi:oligopeptidase B